MKKNSKASKLIHPVIKKYISLRVKLNFANALKK